MKKQINLNSNYTASVASMRTYLRAVGYQKGTRKAMENNIIHFLEWLESEGIKELKSVEITEIKDFEKYLNTRENQTYGGSLSSRAIYAYLAAVRQFFEQEVQRGFLVKNPMSGYKLPKVSCEKSETVSQSEVKILYENCASLEERIILHLYYGLGLRRSEGLALNIKAIDFRNSWLHIVNGKGGKGRTMPLTPEIESDLKAYLLEHRPRVTESALLLNKNKKRMKGYTALKILRKLLKKAKIEKKIGLHSLRHSIATHLIESGMCLEQVRQYLGHTHLETTQKYVHYDTERVFKSKVQ